LPLSMLNNPTQAYTAPDAITNRNALIALKGSHFIAEDELLEGNVYYRASNAINANSNNACDSSVSLPENCVAKQSIGDLTASNVIASTGQYGVGASIQLSLLDDLNGHKNSFTLGSSIDASRVNYVSNTYGAKLVGNFDYNIDPASSGYNLGGVNLGTRSNYYGLYAIDNFAFDQRWNLTLSGRYNYDTVNLSGVNYDSLGGENSLNGNHTFHRFNPALGLNFNPSKTLTLYGGYNEGMRVPSPVELSCANPAIPCALPTGFASDPDLNMIVSKTWEGGARGHFSAETGWSIAVYNTINQNDIQFISNPLNNGATGFFQNVGDTQRRGLEFGLYGKLDRLTLTANYGWVNATYQSSFTEASSQNSSADPATGMIMVNKGDRIPGIARQILKFRADYDITSAWNAGANLIVSSGQYAHGDENNQDVNGPLGGFAVLNLDSHYHLTSNWQSFVKVTNLFNRNYNTFGILGQNMYTAQSELAVTPSLPRGIWLGLTYQYGGKKNASIELD